MRKLTCAVCNCGCDDILSHAGTTPLLMGNLKEVEAALKLQIPDFHPETAEVVPTVSLPYCDSTGFRTADRFTVQCTMGKDRHHSVDAFYHGEAPGLQDDEVSTSGCIGPVFLLTVAPPRTARAGFCGVPTRCIRTAAGQHYEQCLA